MAMANRGSDVNGILAEKMRDSCVDCHYTSKYWVRLNPNDAIRPIDAQRNNKFFGNAMTRLLLLPIWLPYWFWSRQKEKNEMTEFVVAGAGGGLVDHGLVSKLALEWVSMHPAEFIFGEYDPNIPELQRTFQRILTENT